MRLVGRWRIARLAAGGALFLLADGAFAQSPVPVVVDPDTIRWQAVPSAPGAESRWIVGQGRSEGVYLVQVRVAHGTIGAPHEHPDGRYTEVLSGTLYVGFGDAFDADAVVAVPAGSGYEAPAGVVHYFWARDGEVVMQESGVQPTALRFVEPGDGRGSAPRR